MKKNLLSIASLGILGLLIVGCDTTLSYDENNISLTPRAEAFYVDSPIEGVTAKCRSTVTTTNQEGAFTYEVGQGCSFWLGDILLREEGGVTQGEMVLEDNIEVAQFLQSLDNDNSVDNGITITPQITTTLKENNISTVPQTQEELLAVITLLQEASIDFGGDIVSKEDAQNHINQTKRAINNPQYFKE